MADKQEVRRLDQDKIIMILQKVLGLPQRALNKILRIFKK